MTRDARLKDEKNRQNSVEKEDIQLKKDWERKQSELIDLSVKTYKWAIDNGIAKEQARAVLPEGNTVSRMYMNGTLRSWVHYIELRSANGTQKEHMDIAVAIAEIISEIFPMMDTFIE